MRMRVSGTLFECELMKKVCNTMMANPLITHVKVSHPFDNGGGKLPYRVYIDIDCADAVNKNALAPIDGTTAKTTTNKFIKPMIEEIRAYCLERKNGVDPERFYDFYESKGWLIGRTKMKDWRASVRTWEKTQQDDAKKYKIDTKRSSSAHFEGERNYTDKEIADIFGDRSDIKRLDEIEF